MPIASKGPVLELVQVSKEFPGVAGGPPVPVLRNISLTLPAGKSMSIMGASGSGKSTLLNLIGTLERPTSGEVTVCGSRISSLNDKDLAKLRNSKIGFIFQSHHLLPQSTIMENVLLPALAFQSFGVPPEIIDRAKKLLDRVSLGHRLQHRPGELSGGEQQRVAVVRALIHSPALLLADEPTGALDRKSAGVLTELLLELNREEQSALVIVTHARDLALRAETVYELEDGALVEGKR